MWLVEFSLTHRIPVACFSCHKNNKISISWLNYNRKQELLLKNLLQNQQNLKADGIYSCTGIYFFKSAKLQHKKQIHNFHHISALLKFQFCLKLGQNCNRLLTPIPYHTASLSNFFTSINFKITYLIVNPFTYSYTIYIGVIVSIINSIPICSKQKTEQIISERSFASYTI